MRPSRWKGAAAVVCALALGGAGPVAAQEPETLRRLAPTAWLLVGTNGNVVIVADDQGVLLIDDQLPSDLDETLAAARAASPGPVRYVVNTHWHLDHSGGNAGLARLGSVIVAHRNVRKRLGTDQHMAGYDRPIPASPAVALPTVTYDTALELHFGHETVRLHHTPFAHTDGDSLVYLEVANVLHMGDVFFNGIFPFIDRSSGGTIQGLILAVETALALCNADTRVVPAHGAVVTPAELQAYLDMLIDVRDRVQARIVAGDTREEIVALRPASAYSLEGDANRFVAAIHDSLTNP